MWVYYSSTIDLPALLRPPSARGMLAPSRCGRVLGNDLQTEGWRQAAAEALMPLLADLFSFGDSAKRRLRNLVADPQAAAEQALGQLRDQGGRPANAAEVAAQLNNPQMAQMAQDMWNPGSGVAGILRQGGLRDLVAIHQQKLASLAPWLENGKLPRELLSPSIALNRGDIPQNFGPLTLVGRPDALDPGSGRVAGKIWNRDAYTPRTKQFHGGFDHEAIQEALDAAGAIKPGNPLAAWSTPEQAWERSLRDSARRRNWDRFNQGGFRDMRTMEGGGDLGLDFGHEVAIMSSPTMRSFKEFERNPRGAALIDPNSNPQQASDRLNKQFYQQLAELAIQENRLANSFLGDSSSISRIVREMPELRHDSGAKELEQLVRMWKRGQANLPSQYGELKLTGPIRADATNWAGAVVDPRWASSEQQQFATLKELLRQRGVPTMTAMPEDLFGAANMMSERARPVYGR